MGDDEGATASFRQVEDWLRSLGLICYAQSFYDNGYENLDICRQIEEQDLEVIGVTNVKDKNDIIAGVCRLKQKAVYFELEPEEESSREVEHRKYDPFLLITLVKAELEKSNTQLTEPPYFYLDGSLGSLDSLAERLSYSLEAIFEDVREALDQLRRRQLPPGLYNEINNMMEMQRQQEVKKQLIGPPKPKRELAEEPKAYLNVETPFRRTTSLSKNDHRITKSTTNLADIDFGEDKSLLFGAHKKDKKSKQVTKSYSTRDKSKPKFGFSIRKRSTTAENKMNINRDSFVAKDLTMKQEELIELMTQVKHGEISQDKVVAKATLNYRQSLIRDQELPKKVEKHNLTKKEKKKLDKEEKKRKKGERGKSMGQSMFYCSEINDNETSVRYVPQLTSDNGQVDDVISLGNSSGSDVSRESPDLRSFGEGKGKKMLSNGSALNTTNDSAHSSNASLNSQSGTPNASESRLMNPSSSVIPLTKPAKKPPPIPVRSDHTGEDANNSSNIDQQSGGNTQALFANKKPLKSVLSAPSPERGASGELEKPDMKASKSQEFSGGPSYNTTGKESMIQIAPTDLKEIKLKSLERKQRVEMSAKEKDDNNKESSKAEVIRSVPIPPARTDRTVSKIAPSVTVAVPPASQSSEVCSKDEVESMNMISDQVKTGAVVNIAKKQKPAPPPRKIEKDAAEKKPNVPPRKRRSVVSEVKDESAGDIGTNQEKLSSSVTVPCSKKPVTMLKPSLPPRSRGSSGTEGGKDTKGPEAISEANELSIGDSMQTPGSPVQSIKLEDNLKHIPTFTPRSVKQLIEMKCNLERVDLSEYPYSDQDGSWNVPYLLIKRYAEELDQPIADVIEAMDAVRTEIIEKRGKVAKPIIVKDVIRDTKCDPVSTSVKEWLISRGLPMFIKDFHECGLVSLEHLRSLTKRDILLTGVFENKHVDQLLAYLQ